MLYQRFATVPLLHAEPFWTHQAAAAAAAINPAMLFGLNYPWVQTNNTNLSAAGSNAAPSLKSSFLSHCIMTGGAVKWEALPFLNAINAPSPTPTHSSSSTSPSSINPEWENHHIIQGIRRRNPGTVDDIKSSFSLYLSLSLSSLVSINIIIFIFIFILILFFFRSCPNRHRSCLCVCVRVCDFITSAFDKFYFHFLVHFSFVLNKENNYSY